ncbi:MAG: hypothetical protein R3E12_06155 [Candidatus Eisenbacteria bacterium]
MSQFRIARAQVRSQVGSSDDTPRRPAGRAAGVGQVTSISSAVAISTPDTPGFHRNG